VREALAHPSWRVCRDGQHPDRLVALP
jgi:hypothetical protein